MKRLVLLPLLLIPFWFTAKDDEPPNPADQWPQWRGPLANGTSPNANPPINWDEKTNIKWKTAIPGKGSSTPIIWGDRIFLLTAVDTEKQADVADLPKVGAGFIRMTNAPTTYHQFVVLCINRNDGKVLWQQVATEQVPHEGHHPTHSYAAYSPVTDGRYLYVFFGSRGVYCYDLDGKLQWKRDLGRLITRYGWGEGASPTIQGDTLLVPFDQEENSFFVALDAKTGKTRWRAERDEPSTWATPLVAEYKGQTQVIVMGTNRVRSYDLNTGKAIWDCGGQTLNAIPSPVCYGDAVICMSGYRGFFACSIPLSAKGDVTDSEKLLWTYKRGTPYVPSPLLADDRLYFTEANSPVLTILDPKTGQPIVNRKRLTSLGTLYASPVCAADRVYIADREGTTLVLKKSDEVEVLAANRLDEGVDASPVPVDKQLFLRGEKHLYCIEEK